MKNIFFLLVFLVAGSFGFSACANIARAAENGLIISEVLVGGTSADEEFIELYNPTSADIDLKSLPLKLHIVNSAGTDTSKTLAYVTLNPTIKSQGYFLLGSATFREKHSEIAIGATYSAALVSNGAVYISTSATKDSSIIDSICWGTSAKCSFPLPDPKQNYSLERIENGPDWQESCEAGGTPGKESGKCEDVKSPSAENTSSEANVSDTSTGSENTNTTNFSDTAAAEKVYLNEILPHPKGDEKNEEYIEIMNQENGPVDLFGWTIRDGSKTGKYVFKNHAEIKSGEYFSIYRPESKLALNNSAETVTLFNPRGEITSSVSWNKTTEGSSYNFDGASWKWSKYLTPGKENKFDSLPVVKISKIKTTYKDLYTEFSAKAKDKETKKLKYVWDFGDGKKSYLAKTSHKYLDTGKYTVTLSVSDDSQTVGKSFVISVKNYPRPDLEIAKIVPNPAGNDSDGETIDVKNNSGKKVDLEGWKIATGSGDKIYNHPISAGITLAPGETKAITRKVSKFSLNNKAGKVRLLSPNENIIDEVEYSNEKIAEGEAYVKINGEWQWIAPSDNPSKKEESFEEDSDNNENEENGSSDDGEILGATDENQTDLAPKSALYSPEDKFIFFKLFGLLEYEPHEAEYCPAFQPENTLAYF
ncbi:MAG: lamin tail domain-containing protein [Candidatus Moranbacteria bacterium]|nr:lamin tail domain-containing protein [Candidatus Moranbacteria bacterium]